MADALHLGLNNRPGYGRVTSEDALLEDIELDNAFSHSISAQYEEQLTKRPQESVSSLLSKAEGQGLSFAHLRDRLTSRIPRRIRNWQSRTGWRIGLRFGLYTSIFVLLSNLILLLLGGISHGGFVDGIGTITQGEAKKIGILSTAYHVLINILSTILLTSSNYCMQVLCAPTRAELDEAHSQGKWLDIGLMSVHNLKYIDKRRTLLWYLLIFSSIPLHLFYNSAIFEVTAGQDYAVELVDTAFNSTGLVQMSNKDWHQTYSTQYVPGYGNLHLLVTNYSFDLRLNSNWTWSLEDIDQYDTGCDWMPWTLDAESSANLPVNIFFNISNATVLPYINSTNVTNAGSIIHQSSISTGYRVIFNLMSDTYRSRMPAYNMPGPWSVRIKEGKTINHAFQFCTKASSISGAGALVTHGFAQKVNYGSKVQIALSFMIIVIICNATKVVTIFLTIQFYSSEPVITVGDAVSSFLQRPDFSTIGKCTMDKRDFLRSAQSQRFRQEISERPWKDRRRHYISFIIGKQWAPNMILILACIVQIAALATAFPGANDSSAFRASLRWGTSSQELIPVTVSSFDTKGVLMNAWLANAPQIILSVLYFGINRLCTSLCFAAEWNAYALHRKSLRVSIQRGLQRPTYFLQLPYRWAIPLTVTSGVLHWLLSQSLFLVRFEQRDMKGRIYPGSTCACGYSPLSLLVFTIVFWCLVFVVLNMMLKVMPVRMPIAAHCSFVISAACHPPPDEVEPHLQRVQWGVVRNRFGGNVNHCTFTGEEVTAPEDGMLYA